MYTEKKIGVVVAGGALTGRNALVRSIVNHTISFGWRSILYRDGLRGIAIGNAEEVGLGHVHGIVSRPKCVIGSGRDADFMMAPEVYARNLKEMGIDTLILIGGDGTVRAAKILIKLGIPCVFIPSTLEANVEESDFWIGFQSALNKLADIIEDMLNSDQAYESVSIISLPRATERMAERIKISMPMVHVIHSLDRKEISDMKDSYQFQFESDYQKLHIFLAVGNYATRMKTTREYVQDILGIECYETDVTYLVRGARPCEADLYWANLFGAHAVKLIMEDQVNRAVVLQGNEVTDVDLSLCCMKRS